MIGITERCTFNAFDTAGPKDFDNDVMNNGIITLFGSNAGRPDKTNLQIVGSLASDSVYLMRELAVGGPRKSLKTWANVGITLIVACKPYITQALWFPVDATESPRKKVPGKKVPVKALSKALENKAAGKKVLETKALEKAAEREAWREKLEFEYQETPLDWVFAVWKFVPLYVASRQQFSVQLQNFDAAKLPVGQIRVVIKGEVVRDVS